jgi:beta-xylosidase
MRHTSVPRRGVTGGAIHQRAGLACTSCLVAIALAFGHAQAPATYRNPVLPGDYPDPSVIRVGDEFWATATTSQWAPLFPLLKSADLVNWTRVGAVFEDAPAWSAGSYWAPEIAQDRGRIFVYYTARKKNGPLCVAVATAAQPQGPYTDHGPMICQEAGSIDAALVVDEDGQRYLVWKEDGNSRKMPTPIWAQPLSPDGTALTGTRRELIRNRDPWEAHLVEGPYILRRDGWFYMFYSSDACCGRACNYKLGVARARRLLGPWERNPANPILKGNERWRCPGHGSLVSDATGRTFLLYHAYDPEDFQFAGRQGLLDEVTWTAEGWPEINGGRGPSASAPSPFGVRETPAPDPFVDEFDASGPSPAWQWPWERKPGLTVTGGALTLRASATRADNPAATVLAHQTVAGDYTATTRVLTGGLGATVMAGLAAYGDADNAIGLALNAGRAVLWRRKAGRQETITSVTTTFGSAVLLRMVASGGSRFRFAVGADTPDGPQWRPVGDEADGGYLPPWDRGVRVALTIAGPAGAEARFDWVKVDASAGN